MRGEGVPDDSIFRNWIIPRRRLACRKRLLESVKTTDETTAGQVGQETQRYDCYRSYTVNVRHTYKSYVYTSKRLTQQMLSYFSVEFY